MVPLNGSTWKTVSCETCDTDFAYKLSRTAVGRTEAEARRELSRRLEAEHDAVFCPGCGRYAREMLDTVRRERFACFTVLAGLALLLGAFLGAAAGAWPALVCALGALSLFVVGRVKAARFDPNADARLRMGERSNELVILREEFEVVQELAREQGASLEPLEWRRAALRPYVLYTQPAAAA